MFITRTITFIILATLFIITFFYVPPIFFSAAAATIIIFIFITEWPLFFSPRSASFWIVGTLYLIIPLILLILLNHTSQARQLLFMGFLTTFAFDTFSYLVGSAWGKHKIAPTISPKKSAEGVIGGFLGAGSTLIIYKTLYAPEYSYLFIFCFTALIGTAAFCGDLFESWLKRRAGIKDAGTILPGHGGFLDRIDSLLFTVVAVWVIFLIFSKT